MFQALTICESEWSSWEEQAEDKGKIFHYFIVSLIISVLIVEFTERSLIIIQNSSNPSSQKIWLYDRTTVLLYKVLL